MTSGSWAEDLAREDAAALERDINLGASGAEPMVRDTGTTSGEEVADEHPEITRFRAEAESNLAGWQRAQADYLNLKKRSEQELADARTTAQASLMLSLLPALDDMERAMASATDEIQATQWFGGLRMVHKKMADVFEKAGLQEIEAAGKPFDPNLHEAVATVAGHKDTVIDVYQKGYRYRDRVLRPAMVTVGDGS